ncbi:hypothetical protein N9P58_01935 [Puniceicoccaceae bacterium]|nr:hypothetical protein [Puniceicoccaceae bacterium]
MLPLLFLGFSERKPFNVIPPKYLGEWIAYSRNHMAISGDMVVKEQTIDFALKGTVSYEIIEVREDEIYLKIGKDVDDGLFMRLGPLKMSDYHDEYLDMEVAYYNTQEDALKPRASNMDNVSSWGIYTREIKK